MPDKFDTTEKRASNNAQDSIWVELAEVLLLPPLAGIGQSAARGAIQGAADAARKAKDAKAPEQKEQEKTPTPKEKQQEKERAETPKDKEKEKEKTPAPKAAMPDVSDVLVAGFCAVAPIGCLPAHVINSVAKEALKESMRTIDMAIDRKPQCKAPESAQDIMNEILSVPTDIYNYFKSKPLKAATDFMVFAPMGVVNAKLDKCSPE